MSKQPRSFGPCRIAALAALVALASCETIMAPSAPAPTAVAATPTRSNAGLTGPIDLGDWRRADQNTVMQRFSAHVSRRWPTGEPISTAVADLRSQGFSCAAPRGRGGDPPDQACRMVRTEGECSHIWTVSLYDDAGSVRLSRVRALFDKRCGRDGLAGGPN